MDHRKYKQRLAELVEELMPGQARKLVDATSERATGDAAQKLIDGRFQSESEAFKCAAVANKKHISPADQFCT